MTAVLGTSFALHTRNTMAGIVHGRVQMSVQRRLPQGAEVMAAGGVHFRVWAPRRQRVAVVLESGERTQLDLHPEGNGYFSALVAAAKDGSRYRYQLDDDTKGYPDPASRFQPEGPHGPSQVVDPRNFRWTDTPWR